MVGNRVEKTMRKAGLKKLIGGQWFFPTVNEAVHYCLRHQHTKRSKSGQIIAAPEAGMHSLEVGATKVHVGNEIGFSNELNHGYTTVFISLAEDIPMIMSEITSVFKKNSIAVIRAQV